MNNETLKTPILTQLYRIVAAISFILALVSLGISEDVELLEVLSIGFFVTAAIFALGIAEVIYLIAKIEFNTRDNGHEYQVAKLLSQISSNTKKSTKEML